MRVLLIQPNYDVHIIHPPLGLGYLASYLGKFGHKVQIFDGTLKKALLSDFVAEVSQFKPDLVGITVLSRGHNKAKEIIKVLKKKFKNLPVVIGGTQVTAYPKDVLLDLRADFAVIGEGEITLLELTQTLEKEKRLRDVAGLAYLDGRQVRVNKSRDLINDLDEIPFPTWHLMPPKDYRIAPILEPGKAFPIAPILTTRGCPYDCTFCASNATWKRKLRFRSVENVLSEIKLLKENYGVKEIHICDDNFTADVERAKKFCDALIAEKINLPWQCPNGVRIDKLPKELLEKMKKSGCYALGLGIESGNQAMLQKVNKNLNLKIVPKVLKDLREIRIESYGFFILGFPDETKKTAWETINFALNNDFDRAWFNIFIPYPGSADFEHWAERRKLGEIDWERHDGSTAIIEGVDLSKKEIENLQKLALRKFYLRPKTFLRIIWRLRLKELMTLFMSRFFKKRLKLLKEL